MGATEIERMMIRLLGDNSQYLQALLEAQNKTKETVNEVKRSFSILDKFKSYALQGFGIASGLAAFKMAELGIGSVTGAFKKMIELAADQEQSEISFGVMLGGGIEGEEKARTVLDELKKYAAETPFEFPDMRRAAQQMIQYGLNAEQGVDMIKAIGNVSGGSSAKMGGLAFAFGQTAAAGRLMGQDLNQMINWGFNPLEEMTRTTKKSMSQLRDEMSRGLITAEMVRQAYKSATAEGGRFAGMNERQAKTLTGLWSTLKDNVGFVLADVGAKLIKAFKMKEALAGLIDFTAKAGRYIIAFAEYVEKEIDRMWKDWGPTVKWAIDWVVKLALVIAGFVWNAQENLGKLWKWLMASADITLDWLAANWQITWNNLLHNAWVVVFGVVRYFIMFSGMIAGVIVKTAKFMIDVFKDMGNQIGVNWNSIWNGTMFTGMYKAAGNMVAKMVPIFAKLGKLIGKAVTGQATTDDLEQLNLEIFKQLNMVEQPKPGEKDTLDELMKNFNAGMTNNEKEIQKEAKRIFDEQVAELKQLFPGLEVPTLPGFNLKIDDLPEEIKKKIQAMGDGGPLKDAGKKMGHGLGQGIGHGVADGIKSVGFGSADHFWLLMEYQMGLGNPMMAKKTGKQRREERNKKREEERKKKKTFKNPAEAMRKNLLSPGKAQTGVKRGPGFWDKRGKNPAAPLGQDWLGGVKFPDEVAPAPHKDTVVELGKPQLEPPDINLGPKDERPRTPEEILQDMIIVLQQIRDKDKDTLEVVAIA